MGSTSREKSQTSRATEVAPSLYVFLAMLFGTVIVGRAYAWR